MFASVTCSALTAQCSQTVKSPVLGKALTFSLPIHICCQKSRTGVCISSFRLGTFKTSNKAVRLSISADIPVSKHLLHDKPFHSFDEHPSGCYRLYSVYIP